jgi:hypothetical protein
MVLHVAVARAALVVVERDGTSDPTTSRVLTGSWLWDSSPSSRTPAHLAVDSRALRP